MGVCNQGPTNTLEFYGTSSGFIHVSLIFKHLEDLGDFKTELLVLYDLLYFESLPSTFAML
jgi:hypothetical protein